MQKILALLSYQHFNYYFEFDMKDHSEKIKHLQSLTFKCPKLETCPEHPYHHKELLCLKSTCKDYLLPLCPDTHHQHPTISIKKVVPTLSKWLSECWQEIRTQNIEIESEWKICLVNINYCMDILTEVKKMIEGRNVYELNGFDQMIDLTVNMLEKNHSIESVLKAIDAIESKFGVFEGGKIQGEYLKKERDFRRDKWAKMGGKTKKFSQKALAFSETLAQTVEDKLKYQKRLHNLQASTASRISNLRDILKQNVEEISNLKIQFTEKTHSHSSTLSNDTDTENIEKYLEKCENLRTVQINNRNGRIAGSAWDLITSKLEYLKKLRELKLNIRAQDLKILTQLFTSRPNSIRYIECLHLTITDEPKLDMKDVAQFCNTLQLREAHVTLSRDNINKNNFREFLKMLRVHTSLTKLPMKEFNLNLSKNKISEPREKAECEEQWRKKCHEVKIKSITI